MLTQIVAHKVRSLSLPLAEFIAKQPPDQSAELVAEMYDLVNELRDTYIDQAHKLIERIMQEPDAQSFKWTQAIIQLNNKIKMLQGESI